MKFQVRPGSLWLAYAITQPFFIQDLLPRHLTLCDDVPLLAEESCDGIPKLLYNAYECETPYMCGHRVEVQVLARDDARNTLHLVVLDCLSDTLQWDPERGIQLPNACTGTMRLTQETTYTFCLQRKWWGRRNATFFVAAERSPRVVDLNPRFAVDANVECYHVGGTCIDMEFDEANILQPVRPLVGVNVTNTLWNEYRDDTPTHAFVHEHAMYFDVDAFD